MCSMTTSTPAAIGERQDALSHVLPGMVDHQCRADRLGLFDFVVRADRTDDPRRKLAGELYRHAADAAPGSP